MKSANGVGDGGGRLAMDGDLIGRWKEVSWALKWMR